MPYKDPEAKREWRRRNSQSIMAYMAKWKAENPDKVAAASETQKAKRRELARMRPPRRRSPHSDPAYHRKWRLEQRLRAMQIMGGCCERCGFDDPAALEFDHKEPLLRASRGLRRGDNTAELNDHIRNGTLAEVFQLLCANCHRIKTREAGEYAMRGSRPIGDSAPAPQVTLPLFGFVGPSQR